MDRIFNGIYTALATPYDAAGRVDCVQLERLVEFNRRGGIDRFFVCGSAAEVSLLSIAERKEILARVIGCAPARVIANVGGQNPAEVFDLARHAAAAGADAVCAVAPYYFKYAFKELKAFFRELVQTAGVPVFIYNIPIYTGVTFTVGQLSELLGIEGIAGVKFTFNDLYALERVKTAAPDKCIFNGCDDILLSGLVAGADGGIGANFNVTAALASGIYTAFLAGDIARGRALQQRMNNILEIFNEYGMLKCVKAVLDSLGYPTGGLRAPFTNLTRTQVRDLEARVLPLIS